MPTAVSDIIEGAQLTRSGFNDYSIDRVFYVKGLETDSNDNMLQVALNTTGVPEYDDEHPAPDTQHLRAREFRVEPLENDPSIARVTVTYRIPGTTSDPGPPDDNGVPQIEVGGTLETVQTRVDRNGAPLLVSYTPAGGEAIPYIRTLETSVPRMVRRARRLEQTNPEARAAAFVGRVNDRLVWGFSARKWLCATLTGASNDGGQSWEVLYEFVYNPDTWDRTVVFTDDKGRVPPDALDPITQPLAQQTYRVYPEADFNQLNL